MLMNKLRKGVKKEKKKGGKELWKAELLGESGQRALPGTPGAEVRSMLRF